MELIINKVEYKYPERITIAMWQDVMRYDFKNPSNWADIVHIATGAPKSQLLRANEEALELGVAILVQLCNVRTECKVMPVTELNFGQFVDLDVWLTMGVKSHLADVASILVDTEWADEALFAVEQYSNYRTHIYRQYAELFGLNDEADDEELQPGKVDKLQVARNWYKIMVDLANDDILKIDEVTEQPLIKVFNFMALRKQKQLEENMRIIEQNSKLKTQR